MRQNGESDLLSYWREKRDTGFEPATSTLAKWKPVAFNDLSHPQHTHHQANRLLKSPHKFFIFTNAAYMRQNFQFAADELRRSRPVSVQSRNTTASAKCQFRQRVNARPSIAMTSAALTMLLSGNLRSDVGRGLFKVS